MSKTNFILATDFDGSSDPCDIHVIGWNNDTDYFDDSMTLEDILDRDDKILDNV